MTNGEWLERGALLPDGSRYSAPAARGEAWQILDTSAGGSALLVLPGLPERWAELGLIPPDAFRETGGGPQAYPVYLAGPGRLISAVQAGPYPGSFAQAMAFATALRNTRAKLPDVPLHDAVYVEQLGRLLPVFSGTPPLDDPTVLGTWLSRGVRVSADSFDRLCGLLGWMDRQAVEELVDEAGVCGAGRCRIRNGTGAEEAEAGQLCGRSPARARAVAAGERFTLPGRPDLETFFNENVVEVVAHEEKYRRMGISFPGAIVLHGPPGCGKTFAAERLAEFLGWPAFSIDSGSIGSTYIHGTGRKIAEVFDQAAKNAPSVLLIDEMEAFLLRRSAGGSIDIAHAEEVAEFLRRIPTASQNRVLIIAMTNMFDAIDPAVLRKGRFDYQIEVSMPTAEEVAALLGSLLRGLPVAADADLGAAAERLKGRPLSDAAFTVKEAGRLAAKGDRDAIDNAALTEALSALRGGEAGARRIGF